MADAEDLKSHIVFFRQVDNQQICFVNAVSLTSVSVDKVGCRRTQQNCASVDAEGGHNLVRLVGLEPTTGKTPVHFKPTAYANFATAAPGVYAAPKEYHVRRNVEHDPRALGESAEFSSNCACLNRAAPVVSVLLNAM